MVRLEITIKEISAIATEVSIQEIRRKVTKNEKEVSNIFKKRLKVDEKISSWNWKRRIKNRTWKIVKKHIIIYFL